MGRLARGGRTIEDLPGNLRAARDGIAVAQGALGGSTVRTAIRFIVTSSLLLVATPAFADDGEVARPAAPAARATATPAAPTALPPLPTSPVPASAPVSIAAPASGPGLTVVAPLAGGGTMTATGCRNVTIAGGSADVRAMGACAPVAPAPIADPLADEPPSRKEPPRDPSRKGMIIAAPIIYGIGATITGISALDESSHCHGYSSSHCDKARNWLISYTAISAIVPSTPRMVVGDWSGALLYGAARTGSIIAAAAIDWGKDENWQGPFALGFAIPVTLAVVDLATTPHREMRAEAPQQSARVTSVAPVTVSDTHGKTNGAALSMGGTF
jgi:hypothetical protein